MDIYFKSECIPILWRKIHVKFLNDRSQNCCENTIVISMKNNILLFFIINGTQIVEKHFG